MSVASTGATASTKSSHLLIPAIIGVAVGLFAVGAVLLVRKSEPVILLTDSDAESVQVWIEGEVARPGLYQMQESSTVSDVLLLAGAKASSVEIGGLKPEQVVSNGLQIQVTGGVPPPPPLSASQPSAPVTSTGQLIDINTSNAATLEQLPGIGPVLAGRIIEYRQLHGPFGSIDELAVIDGVSPRMVDEMRSMITAGN